MRQMDSRFERPKAVVTCFLKYRPISLSIADFCKALRLQAAVSVTPGTEFGAQFTQSFRVNFSQDHAAAVAAMQRIVQIVDRYRQ